MKLEGTLATTDIIIDDASPIDMVKHISVSEGPENPFFVFNIEDVIDKLRNWAHLMPRVKPFYAVKCNNDPTLLKVLKDLGIGFDCATKTEIKTVLDMNIDSSRIIYAHPCKPFSHLKFASSNGVDLMTFDCDSELYKVKDLMPNARLVLRIRCDALDAQAPLGMKFGALLEDALGLLRTAKKLDLSVVGVSFHVGSGCREPAVFSRAILAARKVFDECTLVGYHPYLLDIGGGFPGDSNSSLVECASYVNIALEKHFPKSMNVQIIAEPGRYVVSSAFMLATQVISKKEKNTENGLSYMYYINDGLYGSFNCVLFDHQIVVPTLLEEPNSADTFHSSIWGPTCDGLDKVMDDVYLPKMNLGDWIVWKNMGAYTLVAASTFNGLPIPKVHPLISYNSWMMLQKGIQLDWLSEVTGNPVQ